MPSLFYYSARDTRGAVVRGSIQAATVSAALSNLRTRALIVTSLESASSPRGSLAAVWQLGTVSQKNLVGFFRSFATLMRAGVSLRRSLDVVIEACGDARLREALRSVVCGIENGLALSDAMARHPKEFPRLYVAMIKAGEIGGVLDEVLERIATVLERDRAARKRVASALAYPVIVSCAAVGLLLFLVTTIVPMFRSMYEQLHVPLPPVTAALIAAGTALQSPVNWAIVFLTAIALCFAAARFHASARGARRIEGLLFAVPIAGVIVRKTILARFARMFGSLLRSGVGMVAALEVVTDVVTSPRFCDSIADLRQGLREGCLVSQPLARTGLYEPLFIQMVRVGEETGSLDAMLLRIADYYDLDIETMLSALGSMLEPAMILLLGAAVGFIVAAIFIPLYTLIGSYR